MTAEDAVNVFKEQFCGLEAYCEIHRDGLCLTDGCEVWWAIKALEQYKADVQPVRHGHWMLYENQNQDDVNNGNYLYVCSNCNHSDVHAKTVEVPFCWFCGARMDGEQND